MASASPEAQALIEKWRTETDFDRRDELLEEMKESNLFPSDDQTEWENYGLYPDLKDPDFLPKLIRKREFLESKQKTIKESLAEGDKCRSSEDFEINPVQRFVSRILSPRTPYNSFLLYHGVGVGKTCAAITVCESYLEAYPSRKVYIVAPPNIQEGFRRTIFDKEGLKINKKDRNSHRGCTGDIYLALTNTYDEKDPQVIENKVAKAIKGRYEFFGYTSFFNYIRRLIDKLPKDMPPANLEIMKRNILQTEFSNRVIIIDEAHNLRDIITSASASSSASASPEEDEIDDITPQDTSDSKGGKRLTPYLKQVLEVSEGLTLLLMTATPMYNSYTEIIFLLNLLLINDKFPTLEIDDVFDLKTQTFKEGGRALLGKVASAYISFMRGENPLTFPLRLDPNEKLKVWPVKSPSGNIINADERKRIVRLPCVGATFSPEINALYKAKVTEIISSTEGLGITNMDLLIQAGNWIFPSEDSEDEGDILDRIRQGGFDSTFEKEKRGSSIQYRAKDPSWLLEENLPKASAKAAVLLRRLRGCKGVAFVYSRFVASGALTIALALEANGYTNVGGNLLANGSQKGRQCALCNRFEKGHGSVPADDMGVAAHTFKPAKYVLLTGSEDISPDNAKAINAARSSKNINGEEVKVIIGSQIAGEGLDLRYVREVFVFDSWYHLNKLEQIVGRGIRNCSHAALPEDKRNCTISLLVNDYGSSGLTTESIDMYSYRTALRKAITVGNVTRVLKENAMDCTLNRDAILVEGLDPIDLFDSQGIRRTGVNRNDVPLTPMCDWLEDCDYSCYFDSKEISATIPLDKQDTSTYDEYTARFQMNTLRKYIENLFGVEEQMFLTFDAIALHFNTIPRSLLASLMTEMVQKKEFRISLDADRQGRLLHKNGYYVFQPDKINDTSIPIAVRVAHIPILRDEYVPKAIEPEKKVETDVSALIGEEKSKKISVGDEDSEALWQEVLQWAQEIRDGTSDEVPGQLLIEVSELRDSAGVFKSQKERIDMIWWIYENIKESADVRARFADCVIDYFWDEFITYGTRRELLTIGLGDPIIRSVAKDMFWTMEGNTYIRLLNYKNEIEYLCVTGGKVGPCSKAVSEVLSREVGQDPILKSKIDVRFTGYEYGFILYNPKKQKFVFKNGKAPSPGAKVGRGSECAINSKIEYPMKLLEKFGATLRGAGMNDLGLNEETLGRRRIQNSIRICTVCDLVLRYMDKAAVQKKRWFYRPLESKLHGHPLR